MSRSVFRWAIPAVVALSFLLFAGSAFACMNWDMAVYPQQAAPGTTATWTLTGLDPADRVQVSMGGSPISEPVIAGGSTMTGTFVVPKTGVTVSATIWDSLEQNNSPDNYLGWNTKSAGGGGKTTVTVPPPAAAAPAPAPSAPAQTPSGTAPTPTAAPPSSGGQSGPVAVDGSPSGHGSGSGGQAQTQQSLTTTPAHSTQRTATHQSHAAPKQIRRAAPAPERPAEFVPARATRVVAKVAVATASVPDARPLMRRLPLEPRASVPAASHTTRGGLPIAGIAALALLLLVGIGGAGARILRRPSPAPLPDNEVTAAPDQIEAELQELIAEQKAKELTRVPVGD
jgi:hypothetical protein